MDVEPTAERWKTSAISMCITHGDRITDIDHISGGVLWEESAIYGDEGRISKQIDGKLKKYLEARQYLPGYENAPI